MKMNITVVAGGKCIYWDFNGQVVKKTYSESLIGYEILPDESGIVLLEPISEAGSENAVIYNLDGSKRWRLKFPSDLSQGIIFDRVGVSNGKLIVIGIVDGRDVRFEVDYNGLRYINYTAER